MVSLGLVTAPSPTVHWSLAIFIQYSPLSAVSVTLNWYAPLIPIALAASNRPGCACNHASKALVVVVDVVVVGVVVADVLVAGVVVEVVVVDVVGVVVVDVVVVDVLVVDVVVADVLVADVLPAVIVTVWLEAFQATFAPSASATYRAGRYVLLLLITGATSIGEAVPFTVRTVLPITRSMVVLPLVTVTVWVVGFHAVWAPSSSAR